tara:strand:+ start:476 stop:853 length:378 start_codon:yes stop_codon:yes gene_type:complete
MLTKILFTISIIIFILMIVRFRKKREASSMPVNPSSNETQMNNMPIGWLATAIICLMIIASGIFLFLYWEDKNTIINVRVIDSGSGNVENYRVRKGDIDNNEFITVDGIKVTLAKTERLETAIRP